MKLYTYINILKIRKLKSVGGVDRWSLSRRSLLRWSLLRQLLFLLGGQGGRLTITVEAIAVEVIAVEAIAVPPGGGGGVNQQSLLRWSLFRGSLLRQSLLRQLLFLLGGVNWWSLLRQLLLRQLLLRWLLFLLGGGVDRRLLLRWSLLRRSLLRQLLLRQLLLRWSLLRGSTQNCIMGIVRCIMGNAFSSTTDLQVPSVCTSFVKLGIYWEKNKEDRLVYSFLV